MSKIGVYICKCSGNISDSLKFEELKKAAEEMEDVVVVREHELYCGQEGQDVITKDVAEGIVDRVVTVACSPKMHDKTFIGASKRGGLNPYLLHMVNIREQCIWMTPDKDRATEKVIRMMKGGIKRAKYLEALEQKEIEINTDVMVIGGGIAGVEAALELANAGRKVYLVEKEAAFGGYIVKLEHTYPSGECAPCILAPRMKELVENENITLLPLTQVKKVTGFGGNFLVEVEEKASFVKAESCIGCMMCIEECPVEGKNAFNGNMNNRKAIDFLVPGTVPKAPYINREMCKRFKGEECTICKDSCDFEAIDYGQEDKIKEIKVGSVIIAIGGRIYEAGKVFPELMKGENNIFTGLDMERFVSTTGPSKGKILLKNGEAPKSVAILHCVGSRNERHLPYCSGICCKYALKHSEGIKEQLPECQVTHIYNDLCLEGKEWQEAVKHLKKEGVKFLRWELGENSIAELNKNGEKIAVSGKNLKGEKESIEVEMVLLAVGLGPNPDLSALAEEFSLSEKEGYIVVRHEKIGGVGTTAEGVYLAGTANGAKDITQSVIEAKAACGEILSTYIPGQKLKLEPAVAESDPDLCGGCKICIKLCPYKAPSFDEEKEVVVVSDVLCKGCGTCVAACPTGAMKAKNYTSKQITSEIEGVLQ